MNQIKNYLLTSAIISLPASAQAYVGPALGGSTIAVILGLVASIAFALFTVIWYPIKHMRKKRKQKGLPDVDEVEKQGKTD